MVDVVLDGKEFADRCRELRCDRRPRLWDKQDVGRRVGLVVGVLKIRAAVYAVQLLGYDRELLVAAGIAEFILQPEIV